MVISEQTQSGRDQWVTFPGMCLAYIQSSPDSFEPGQEMKSHERLARDFGTFVTDTERGSASQSICPAACTLFLQEPLGRHFLRLWIQTSVPNLLGAGTCHAGAARRQLDRFGRETPPQVKQVIFRILYGLACARPFFIGPIS